LGYIQDDKAKTSNQATFITKLDDDGERMERTSQAGSEIEPFFQKPKAIDYLNKGRD